MVDARCPSIRFDALIGFPDHCFGNAKRLGRQHGLLPVSGLARTVSRDNATPSLRLHYRGFNATMGSSAPDDGLGILPHGVSHLSFPFASIVRFSRSDPTPVSSSCHLYTGCRRRGKQVAFRLVPGPVSDSGFGNILRTFDASSVIRLRSSSRYVPGILLNAFSRVAHDRVFWTPPHWVV